MQSVGELFLHFWFSQCVVRRTVSEVIVGFFFTLSSALTGNSLSSSSIFYCRIDRRGIDEKREREREKERRKAAGDGKGCSQRVDNF